MTVVSKFNYILRPIYSIFISLKNQIFQPTCALCLQDTNLPFDICAYCYSQLPWINNHCYQCGTSLITQANHIFCAQCQENPPPFDRVASLFAYKFPIKEILAKVKYANQVTYSRLLGELMADYVQNHWYPFQPKPEAIIPMPLHSHRLKQRGFNQSVEIAKIVSKKTHIPLLVDLCYRTKNTTFQARLSKSLRSHNMHKAFYVKTNSFQHIAIIDDVFTTGQTVKSLSIALKNTGIDCIDIWSICRR